MNSAKNPVNSRALRSLVRLRAFRRQPVFHFEPLEQRQLLTVFGPLFTFQTWNQDGPIGASVVQYNQYCPIDPDTGARSVTGCAPTAEAEVCYYWQFPKRMTFSSLDSYYSTYTSTPINIDGDASTLQFPSFGALNSALSNIAYNGQPTEEALLVFGIGIKSQANYSSSETGAYLTASFFTSLGFTSAAQSYDWTNVKSTVVSNLESGQPVLLDIRNSEGSGHAVVLDGYDTGNDTFHVIFGWNGNSDGWYTTPNFGTSYGFNSIREVIYNIKAPVTIHLLAPLGFSATQGLSTDPVRLTWQASEGATGYEIWRSTSDNIATARKIASVAGDDESFDDTTAPDGTAQYYYYWIRATDDSRQSDLTDSVCGYRRLVTVAIPDAALEAAVRTALNKSWGYITNLDLLTLKTLDASGAKIRSLSGLEYATNLTSLDLHNNAIADITPLAPLHSLTTLHLEGNQISDISSLSQMPDLTVLSLDNNHITDLSPLDASTRLWTLSFDNNQVADLSPLADMQLLNSLSFDNNVVSDLSPLADNLGICTLSFSNNRVTDLTPVSALRNLVQFNADGNLIADISPMAGFRRLTSANLKANRFNDISALASLSRLTQLDVSANYLDISAGSDAANLIAALRTRGAAVNFSPQFLPPQTVSAVLPTTFTYTLGTSASLSILLKCPTAPSRPYTGTVTLEDDKNAYLASAAIASNGKILWSLATLAPGSYTCTVNFPGDCNHLAMESASFTLIVLPAVSKTTLASSLSAPVVGQSFALNATVTPASSLTTPRTGTVTFYDGTTALGTVALDANSRASFVVTPSAVGKHSYTAVYNGDTNFKTSTSKAATVKIQKASVTAQPISGAGASVLGHSVTFSVTFAVTGLGAGTPTGLVTFKDGTKVLGTATLDAHGVAQFTFAFTSLGNHKISASYAGDANFKSAVAASVLQTVIPAPTTAPALARFDDTTRPIV